MLWRGSSYLPEWHACGGLGRGRCQAGSARARAGDARLDADALAPMLGSMLSSALLAVLVAIPQAPQSNPAPPTSATALGSGVTLIGVDGRVETRPPSAIQGTDPRQLGAQVLVFDATSPAPSPDACAATVALNDGERWVGALSGLDAEHLQIELAPKLALRATIDELRSIVFQGRLPSAWSGTLEPAKEGDRLYLVRADALDRIDGAIEEFSAQGVRFHGERVDSRVFPWAEVAALFVEGAGHTAAAEGADANVRVVADLVQGSRLRGVLRSMNNGQLVLAPHTGEPLTLSFNDLRQLYVDDGSVRYLSELEPARAQASRPFGDDLGMSWKHRVDRSVTGGGLRAAGKFHARGLGVHAPSQLAWTLEPGWKTLRGRVAIDDEVLTLSAKGSVVFRVLTDGKKAWESPVVRGGEAPVELPPIDLAQVKELVLEVDAGPDSFVADRADWLDLLLSR